MQKSKKHRIEGAAPGLHDLDAERTERRNRRLAWLVPLALVASGFVHEVTPDEKPVTDKTEQPSNAKTQVEKLIESGAEVHNSVYVMRPRVRLYDSAERVEVANGKGPDGREIPTVPTETLITYPVMVTNENGTFVAVPQEDGGVLFASTEAEKEVVDELDQTPFAEEIALAGDAVPDTATISEVTQLDGEPHLQAELAGRGLARG